ncbi:hypothetical protein [Pedobacter steynii]
MLYPLKKGFPDKTKKEAVFCRSNFIGVATSTPSDLGLSELMIIAFAKKDINPCLTK